jgi:general stress protein CsbA
MFDVLNAATCVLMVLTSIVEAARENWVAVVLVPLATLLAAQGANAYVQSLWVTDQVVRLRSALEAMRADWRAA